ncbi:MAG: Re/Si-specific NAD(P)(+) transhydrogenase subunit alpha, partial [Bdellovibrionales bacterium]|nr:Re/Si-specific NAD(P)(+) transhydrogenase subunit alpha [Bdellovibrionales bacterium]
MSMLKPRIIGVPKETKAGEARIALSPEGAHKLIEMGFQVFIEKDAGNLAHFPDSQYQTQGAKIVENAQQLWNQSDIILKINPPMTHPRFKWHEAEQLQEGAHLISLIWPSQNSELLQILESKKATVIGLDCIPRISRAQKMDVLSSMANIAGYRAVVEAAYLFGRYFTGQITAAGKVPPAKVLIIGAGVAGLSAIGTARGLGAIVKAFDTRPEVREQVQSMGAEFLEIEFNEESSGEGGYAKLMSPEFIAAEMKLFAEQAKEVDIIITTALVPGKKAPRLLDKKIISLMKEGSVVVDMAAEQGGNCELSQADQIVIKDGVSIIGYTNLPSRLSSTSSQLFSSNMVNLLSEMCKDDKSYRINTEDEVIRGALIIHEGKRTWPPPPVSETKERKILE